MLNWEVMEEVIAELEELFSNSVGLTETEKNIAEIAIMRYAKKIGNNN